MSPSKEAVGGGLFQSPEISYLYSDKHEPEQWKYYHQKHVKSFANQFILKAAPEDYSLFKLFIICR